MKQIKNSLIDKARELKFKSYFGTMITVNEDCYHLWLEDLRIWLHKNHEIEILIARHYSHEKWCEYFSQVIGGGFQPTYGFINYQFALEHILEKNLDFILESKKQKDKDKDTFDLLSIGVGDIIELSYFYQNIIFKVVEANVRNHSVDYYLHTVVGSEQFMKEPLLIGVRFNSEEFKLQPNEFKYIRHIK